MYLSYGKFNIRTLSCFSLLTSLIRRPFKSRHASLFFDMRICLPNERNNDPKPPLNKKINF